ncbi:hypothetical protein AAHI06_17315 [Pseudomonas salmasensis]
MLLEVMSVFLKEDLLMTVINGVLQSKASQLVAPNIIPSSTDGKIYRSEIAGNKARIFLPDYDDKAIGDEFVIYVDTDGEWDYFGVGKVESMDKEIVAVLYDALFADATLATAYYTVKNASGERQSAKAEYRVED